MNSVRLREIELFSWAELQLVPGASTVYLRHLFSAIG